MSIYAVKLSDWIDKSDPKCIYKDYVKTMISIKKVCSNPTCNKRVNYGMVDVHSAPFGYGDGVCCSWKCREEMFEYQDRYRPSKRTLKRRKLESLNMVAWLQRDSTILSEERKKQLPMEHGVTQTEVDEYIKTWNGKRLIDLKWERFVRKENKKKKANSKRIKDDIQIW